MSTRSLNSIESVERPAKSRKHIYVFVAASGLLSAGLATLIVGCAAWIRVLVILGPVIVLVSVVSYVYGFLLLRKSRDLDPCYVEPRQESPVMGPPRTLCVMSLDSSLSLAAQSMASTSSRPSDR